MAKRCPYPKILLTKAKVNKIGVIKSPRMKPPYLRPTVPNTDFRNLILHIENIITTVH